MNIIAKNTPENGILEPLLPARIPMITKTRAVDKINNLYARIMHLDDHFIQEPLASVSHYEAR